MIFDNLVGRWHLRDEAMSSSGFYLSSAKTSLRHKRCNFIELWLLPKSVALDLSLAEIRAVPILSGSRS